VEVAVAETDRAGEVWTGVNFSPTFADPLADTLLSGHQIRAYGVHNFLTSAHVAPGEGTPPYTAVAVHLICPVLDFLDRGKTRLKLPTVLARQVADPLWAAVKELWREGEQRRKDAARAERVARARDRHARQAAAWTVKEAVFAVLPVALVAATGEQHYP